MVSHRLSRERGRGRWSSIILNNKWTDMNMTWTLYPWPNANWQWCMHPTSHPMQRWTVWCIGLTTTRHWRKNCSQPVTARHQEYSPPSRFTWLLNDWVNPKKKTSAPSAQSFRRNLFIKTYRFAMIKQINRIYLPQLWQIQQISAFLAKAHPDGCKSRARLFRVIRINPSNGLPISENPFNPHNLWLKIKISVQSAQSFRRNLFIKHTPSPSPYVFISSLFHFCVSPSLSFSVASRSAKLQSRDCKIASSRKNLCLYVSFFKKYSRCHMKKRYLCKLLSTGACA